MPKLNKNQVQAASQADPVGSFEPLTPGIYTATLAEVEVRPNQNHPDHFGTWVFEFDNIQDAEGNKKPGRLWYNVQVITDESMPGSYAKGPAKWEQFVSLSWGRLRSFFENMGFTVDSDTDEMIGEVGALRVGMRTIQNGPRAGEQTNEVTDVLNIEDYESMVEARQDNSTAVGADSDDEF